MNGESSRYDKLGSMLEGGSSVAHNVPLKYLRNITNDFSDERQLGEGGFGTVYKGVLQNGEMIAVKKLNSSIPGVKDRQFENEAGHLMRLKHPNIVLLIGWCSDTENIYMEYNGKYICAEKSERLLCLEYMPKGNLRGYLSDESSGFGWDTRYKIIEGICYGLCYLHEEWQLNAPVVHMDLKPANILLDNNMVPKIADFGLSRLFSEEKTWTRTISRDGTLGYMSPEYINRGLISTKSDIFSLGVIIIEIVTGRRDYPDDTGTPSEEFIERVLHNWTQRKEIKSLFGVSLEVDYQQIRRCIQIGLDCVKTDRSKRPTISQIIKALHRPEGADSSNIKGVHGPQSGKRERNCGETSWMERLAKKHTPCFSIYETFTVALHQWQKKIALKRIRVIFTAVVFVVLLKKRGGKDDDLANSLMWLRDTTNPGLLSLNFGGFGTNPWMQPRLDASLLGLQPDMYQAMPTAAFQDPTKQASPTMLHFQQPQNIAGRATPLLSSQILQQAHPKFQQQPHLQNISESTIQAQGQSEFLRQQIQCSSLPTGLELKHLLPCSDNSDQVNRPPATFVRVYKSGTWGRSLDITRFSSYHELRREIGRLFGLEGQLEDPLRSGWQLVFVDGDEDVFLLGDDPWQEFVNEVSCIKILSPQEAQQMFPCTWPPRGG